MTSVVNANWDKGRAAQKLRTRQALMDTAVELVKAGRRPSVSAVADQAGVSRATAYRYFPSQDLMLSEAMIRAAAGPDTMMPAGTQAADPAKVAAAITRQAGQFSLDHEERLRTALRLSLDPSPDTSAPDGAAGGSTTSSPQPMTASTRPPGPGCRPHCTWCWASTRSSRSPTSPALTAPRPSTSWNG